jgi:hypothetical protein
MTPCCVRDSTVATIHNVNVYLAFLGLDCTVAALRFYWRIAEILTYGSQFGVVTQVTLSGKQLFNCIVRSIYVFTFDIEISVRCNDTNGAATHCSGFLFPDTKYKSVPVSS